MPQDQAQYAHITTSTTTSLNARQGGVLKRIVVNTGGAGWAITVNDGATVVAVVSGVTPISLEYNLQYSNGLSIITAGATPGDLTVVYT